MTQSSLANILLFGDQAYDFVPALRELLRYQGNPILTAFLDQAHYVLRAQMMESLPRAQHKLARTATLAQMVRKYEDDKLPASFATPLCCTTQLGVFIRDHASSAYPTPSDCFTLGLCGGALPAVAVSCSTSLSQLLPLAVHTVLVAFRLGLCVSAKRDELEGELAAASTDMSLPMTTSNHSDSHLPHIRTNSDSHSYSQGPDFDANNHSNSWAVTVSARPEHVRDAIDDWSRVHAVPKPGRPWISGTTRSCTTISGPPRLLESLLRTPSLNEMRTRWIPVYIPAHNAQIFSAHDVDEILGPLQGAACMASTTTIPFVSSVSGRVLAAASYEELMVTALSQILLQPLPWEVVQDTFPALLKACGTTRVRIVSASGNAQPLSSALKEHFDAVEVEPHAISAATATTTTSPSLPSYRPDDGKDKIAVVSMSGRFPEAFTTEAFWDLLHEGLDVVKEVPRRRWDILTHVDASGKTRNKGATKWGCWLDCYDRFDNKFFSISPKEAPQMDPAQRMALMTTYEAMERGGIVPDSTPSTQRNRIGVFHGVTSNDWMEVNTAQNVDTYFITGGNRAFIPGRINFCFEFSGPSYANDTACSSSLAAIHLACNSLWRGDCDTAVAGGTNMIFMPDGHTGLDKGFFLSRTGNCKTFDDAADGYCRAEGVGTVFLKRLEDAIADKDPILGTILSIQTNHSSMSDSITRPLAAAQIDNMNSVLDMACVEPDSLSYIEMHGTGTQVGDAEEMKSVLTCFAPNEKARGDQPLWVGSAKANVGHGEGVSGVTSLIKVLLMMKHDTIPPHYGIKPGSKINRNFPDLGARNVRIALDPTPWPRTDRPRRALINNFSAAGGNTALLIEDAPVRPRSAAPMPRSSHLVTVSAHNGKSLTSNLELLLAHLQENEPLLPHLAYTTTARRWHHLHRVAVSGRTIGEVRTAIGAAIENGDGFYRPKAKPSIVFAFTGQAALYFGMAQQLKEQVSSFATDIRHLEQLAQSHGFPAFTHVYAAQQTIVLDDLAPIDVQLALTCMQIALTKLLRLWGIEPSVIIGHSLGEYAAMYTAGVLSASDAVYLVGSRAEIIQNLCQRGTHAMLSVKASASTLETIMAKYQCEVSCKNGPQDTVISGEIEQVKAARSELMANGVKCLLFSLPYAFHSAQLDPCLEEFKVVSQGAQFLPPKIPVLSTLTAEVIDTHGIFGPSYLTGQFREPVELVAALEKGREKAMIRDNSIIIEFGPKDTLCNMIKATLGHHMRVFPTLCSKGSPWESIQAILSAIYTGGIDINWASYHNPFLSSCEVVDLPSYGWDLKSYDIPYEGDWILHRHKIHCNCADKERQWLTSDYVPGKHTFAKNVLVPGDAVATAACEFNHRMSKRDPTVPAYPGIRPTTTVHRIISEDTQPLGATLVFETDLSRKDTNDISKGHSVDGIPLATPSFYADIALQVGKYAMDRIRAGHPETNATDGLVDVSELVIDKALIPRGGEAPQLLRTHLTMTWPPKAAATTRSGKIRWGTHFENGKLDRVHATCTVRFTTESQLKTLRKKLAEYETAIQRLHERMAKGELTRYSGTSGYKLMSSLASFHPDYKLLDRVLLNHEENEATCVLRCDESSKDSGEYAAHPAYVDAMIQLSSFAMNSNDNTDLEKEVYTNHGWASFQIYRPLQKGISYTIYTKMAKDQVGDLVHGDAIVLDGRDIVAFFRDISLRCVPRKVLRAVLGAGSNKGARQSSTEPSEGLAPAAREASPPIDGSATAAPATSQSTASPTNGSHMNATKEDKDAAFLKALKIIAEEAGVAADDFAEDSAFVDAGIDSLCSLVIGSRLREELNLDLDPDFSIFDSVTTIADLRKFLGADDGDDTSTQRETQITPSTGSAAPMQRTDSMDLEEEKEAKTEEAELKLVPYCRPTKSVILQGIPKDAQRILFMLPDGSGSASSYAVIPRLAKGIALIGLNCPYSREPESMNCTHHAMIQSFINEIKRRQPNGPYHVGGWSSGGGFAYMVAEALVNMGDEVHSLIVIDAPIPQPMEKLPVEFYEYTNSLGLFATHPGTSGKAENGMPSYLIPHFIRVVDVTYDYQPAPLRLFHPTSKMPTLGLIWATDTVMDEKTAPKMHGMHFMIQKRTDFGPDGWDELIPGGVYEVWRAEGANHFTLMQPPHVMLVKELIDRVVGQGLGDDPKFC